MSVIIPMTPTQALASRLHMGNRRLFLTPWNRVRDKKDTILVYTGYYEGLPHLFLIETDRWFPDGQEVLLYPSVQGDSICFEFTDPDGGKVSVTADSRIRTGDTVTFEFDLPPEVS